jgi:hypothetical protein
MTMPIWSLLSAHTFFDCGVWLRRKIIFGSKAVGEHEFDTMRFWGAERILVSAFAVLVNSLELERDIGL